MKRMLECVLTDKKLIRNGLYDYYITNSELAKQCAAGQFLNIHCGDGTTLLRPISICDVSGDTVRFVFEVRGKGTAALSQLETGAVLKILGPLGNGFSDTDFSKKTLFIGGGIGVFPLLLHAKKYSDAYLLAGFRSAEYVCMEEDFKAAGVNVCIATDDGSYGYNGFVTGLMREHLDAATVFCCGPEPMLKSCAAIANDADIFCEVSTEQRMGCGIGACLVCACKKKTEDGYEYAHVCKDGPVFNSKDIIFD